MAHIVAHVQFLFSLISVHIQGNYGHVTLTEEKYNNKIADGTITQNEKEDYEAPGPFSLVSCLQAMLKGDFYADEITLIILSMKWQVRVTVLNGETLHQIKIRHGNKIGKVDIAVVHCSSNHYLPLGECAVIVVFHATIHNIHAATDVVSTAIFCTCSSIFDKSIFCCDCCCCHCDALELHCNCWYQCCDYNYTIFLLF